MIDVNTFELVAGTGLGPLRLGMPRHDALALIGPNYSRADDAPGVIVQAPLRLSFSGEPGRLSQILVTEGFRGTTAGGVRVGMRVGELFERLGAWREIQDAYYCATAPFTCFEPGDDDDDDTGVRYDELEEIIRYISVFAPGPVFPERDQWQRYVESLPARPPFRPTGA